MFRVPFEFWQSNELRSVSSVCETFAIIISRQWIRRDRSRYVGVPSADHGVPRRTQYSYEVTEQVWIFNETDGFVEIPSLETTFESILPNQFEKLLRIR